MTAHRLCSIFRRRRVPLLVLFALATLFLGAHAVRLDRDNSLAAWVAADDPDWLRFCEFRRTYAVADPLMIYLPGTAAAEAAPLVRRLRTLARVDRVFLLAFDDAPAGEKAACAIALDPVPSAERHDHERLAREVPGVVAQELPGRRAHFGGVWWITQSLDDWSDRATSTFFPIVFVLLALTVWAFLRDVRDVVLALAAGVLPTVLLAGTMELAGQPLNIVLVAVPPLTLILGITYAIHMLLQSRGVAGDARLDVIADVFHPTLAAAGTTVLGFLSLFSGNLEPVWLLGVWGAIGVGYSLATALVLVPALAHLGRGAAPPPEWVPRSLAAFRRTRWAILLVNLAALVASAGFATRIRNESHILNFFAEDAPIRRDYSAIENAGIGLTPIELDLEAPGPVFQAMRDGISAWADAQDSVTHLLWPADAVGRLRMTEPTAHGAFLTARPLPEDANPLLGLDPTRLRPAGRRITFLLRTLSTQRTVEFMNGLQAEIDRQLAGRGRACVTGSVPLLVRMQDRLLRTLLWSFGTAFLTVFPVMALALRSIRLGLLALVPNVIPVVFMLGIMGAFGIPLDVATVTVASITFGVLVDDTIHFMHAYRHWRQAGHAVGESLQRLLSQSGYAMITATCVSGVSFLGFLASPFVPLRDFGLLTSLTFWLGITCDMILVPALLLTFKGDREARGA